MSDKVKIVTQTIYTYVLVDDILKSIKHKTDKRALCSDSEIITTALISSLYYGGNYSDAIGFVQETGLMPTMVGESRFNRRLHRLDDLIIDLFFQLGLIVKSLDKELTYRIDSFPVKCCHNIRIKRSKLFKNEEFRGYNASKREYFYGLKVFVITNADNLPVEYSFTPGSWAEIDGFRQMPLDLPEGSVLYGDSGFTDYGHEDDLLEGQGIAMKIARKKNAKRQHEPWWNALIRHHRKPIETTFSEITNLFGRKIHATTQNGFILKIVLTIFAHFFDKIIN